MLLCRFDSSCYYRPRNGILVKCPVWCSFRFGYTLFVFYDRSLRAFHEGSSVGTLFFYVSSLRLILKGPIIVSTLTHKSLYSKVSILINPLLFFKLSEKSKYWSHTGRLGPATLITAFIELKKIETNRLQSIQKFNLRDQNLPPNNQSRSDWFRNACRMAIRKKA